MRAESLQEAVDGAWDIKAATCTVASGWRKAMVAYPTAFVAARFTGTKLLARTSERGRKCSGSSLRAAVQRKFYFDWGRLDAPCSCATAHVSWVWKVTVPTEDERKEDERKVEEEGSGTAGSS